MHISADAPLRGLPNRDTTQKRLLKNTIPLLKFALCRNTMPNPYAPPNASRKQLLEESGWFQGAIIGSFAYGIDFTLYCLCVSLLLKRKGCSQRLRNILLIFSTLIFLLSTTFMASLAGFAQLAFINDRNYPGGPAAFETEMFSIPLSELGNVSFVLSNWLSDCMMIWRCYIIFRGSGIPEWIVMLFPSLLAGASLALGILWLIQISTNSPFGTTASINWTIPYISVSLALNIIITCLIVGRLWLQRYRLKKVLGSDYGAHYTTLATMIIESSSIYSTYSLLFLIPFVINSPISPVFLQSLCQIQTASSLLIVFRVAKGKGWNSNSDDYARSTASGLSTRLRFRQRNLTTSIAISTRMADNAANASDTSHSTGEAANSKRR